MTNDDLRALVAKWRGRVGTLSATRKWDGFDDGKASAYESCADELEAALTGPLAQGWVMVPVKYANEDSKKIGWTLDMDWVCGLEPKDAEYWPGLEEAEAVILALIAAAPPQTGDA